LLRRWHPSGGGRASGLHPTLRKSAKDGAPELLWSVESGAYSVEIEWSASLARSRWLAVIRIRLRWGGFTGGVVVEAAPAVVFGVGDESAVYGVAVDVADLLYELARCEGVEVVVTGLPELFAGAFEEFGGFAFDDSEEGGEGVGFWFAGEEVNVLGHEDVGVDGEVVGVPRLFDDLFENVFWV